jgi:large subunit ribosomal protein L17
MRHRIDHRKLGRTTEHRIAMLRNQAISLFKHDRVKTTLEKAKELRRFAEKLITLAKKDTLHARRIAARDVHDPDVLKKLFATLGPLYASRPGGYTRIVKLGWRKGDGAEVALIELVGREPKTEEKPTKDKKAKKAAATEESAEAPKKVSPKKRPLASEKGVRPDKAPAKKAKAKAEPEAAPEETPEA